MKRTANSPAELKKNIRDIDSLFSTAGLTRSRRATPAGITTQLRAQRARIRAAEDLRPAAPEPVTAPNGVRWLPVPGWQRDSWLWAGFSTRQGGLSRAYCADDAPGELNLGLTPADDRETVLKNRALLAEAVTGSAATPLVPIRQVHSNLVVRLTAADAARTLPWKAGVPSDRSTSLGWKADGSFTSEPGILLAVQTADCIPVLVADRKQHVVGAFHAGWRGTVKRIVELGVGRMRLEFGSRPEDLVAAIGPGVGPCCYAVGDEVRTEFESQFVYAQELFHEVSDSDPIRTRYPMLFLTQRAPGHSPIGPALHMDLVEANRRQLLDAGLKPRAIRIIGGCTQCHRELFFSHRGAQGHAGRLMAVIGIRPR